MKSLFNIIKIPFIIVSVLAFIVFYPMLISIYVFLPLLIGVMGYLFMTGVAKNNILYILVALAYFINLEVNLSLPFSLTTIATLIVYVTFYSHLGYFRKCMICRPIISVLLVDVIYLGLLVSYDFVFQTHSIVVDNILLYSLVIDLLVVVLF